MAMEMTRLFYGMGKVRLSVLTCHTF